MKKTLYITQETQDRLAKLGGPTPSENLRRAVALAECADELAKTGQDMVDNLEGGDFISTTRIDALSKALTNYRSAKQ